MQPGESRRSMPLYTRRGALRSSPPSISPSPLFLGQEAPAFALAGGPEYDLLLFIAGASPRAQHAEHNVRALCDRYLRDRYHLAVIDLQRQPARAQEFDVLGIPMLLKRCPGLERRLVGDCSDAARVLKVLGL